MVTPCGAVRERRLVHDLRPWRSSPAAVASAYDPVASTWSKSFSSTYSSKQKERKGCEEMKLTVTLAAVTTGAVASTYIGSIPALLLCFFAFPRVHSSDKEEISEKESNVVSQLTFAAVLVGPYLVARCFGYTADLDASAARWLAASVGVCRPDRVAALLDPLMFSSCLVSPCPRVASQPSLYCRKPGTLPRAAFLLLRVGLQPALSLSL